MTELKAIIFDVDGTLANTEEAHRMAFNTAFKQADLSWNWDVALYTKLLKVTGGKERIFHYVTEYLKDKMEQEKINALHKVKNELYQAIIQRKELPLRSGILSLIKECKDQNMTIAIATTTSPGNVHNLVTATMGEDALAWFEVIADAESAPIKKPAPDVYEFVLNKLNLKAEETIAIEDSYNGVVAATKTNIPTVITVNNYTQNDDFTSAMLVVDELGDDKVECNIIDMAKGLNEESIEKKITLNTLKNLHAQFISK